MEWKKFEQQNDYFPQKIERYGEKVPLSGEVYKEHLVVLPTERGEYYQSGRFHKIRNFVVGI